MELATGIFKRELMLRRAGCLDPWAMKKPMKRGAGRENDPTEVPSAFDGRLVGCLCLGDRGAKWMWLEKGAPKRCECGHYFVLKNVPAVWNLIANNLNGALYLLTHLNRCSFLHTHTYLTWSHLHMFTLHNYIELILSTIYSNTRKSIHKTLHDIIRN